MTFANAYDADLAAQLGRALAPAITVGAPIGRGGFALVYAGVDTALKRDVAVKVLRPELAVDEVMRARFRREAEAVARLRHPHIVPIYSVGEQDGIVWYVMPLLSGPSLKVHLERSGRLAIPDVRRVIDETADALATAHRAGIVHRDIKPDNMLLDGPPSRPRVLVTDFGIAKALSGTTDSHTLTQTGIVIGTPHYMSPEQAAGEPTDARSDIYSLGVVVYQLLTGELPFEAPTVAALLVKQLQDDAPSVLRRRPDCPSDLAAAVARCLAKDPGQRWQSADDLRSAVAASATQTLAARRSSGTRTAVVVSPIQSFRTTVFVSLGVIGALAVFDAVRRQVLLAPLGALVAAFVWAVQYGRLWTAGYEWRDLWRSGATGSSSPVPLDSAEFGPHEGAIQQARAERAAIRVQFEKMPRVTRPRFESAVRAADGLLGQAGALGRQLYGLERQIDPGPEEIERRLAATESEPSSPGRAQRLAVLERRRDAVRALARRRDALAATLTTTLTALASLRAAIEQEPERLDDALRVATGCLESAQPT
jgi:tRNA A-37 threonylcarbamoyl transferase component Bud32